MIDLFGNEPMMALSWKQPYAGLMLPPFNKIETRTWPTKYRGLVLICASQKDYKLDQIFGISGAKQYYRIIETLNHIFTNGTLLNGHAIGVGRLVDCRPMTKQDEDKCYVNYPGEWYHVPKDGVPKKKRLYCHEYADVRAIEPIPFKGAQGFRKVTDEVKQLIKFI